MLSYDYLAGQLAKGHTLYLPEVGDITRVEDLPSDLPGHPGTPPANEPPADPLEQQIQDLPGVDDDEAAAIMEVIAENGGQPTMEQLVAINGVAEKTAKRVLDLLEAEPQ